MTFLHGGSNFRGVVIERKRHQGEVTPSPLSIFSMERAI